LFYYSSIHSGFLPDPYRSSDAWPIPQPLPGGKGRVRPNLKIDLFYIQGNCSAHSFFHSLFNCCIILLIVQASCPIHTAPPILSLSAPVTEDSTLYSCRHLNTPINAMANASLNFTISSAGITTSIFNRSK
jgi:hypothetical protein